MKYMIDDKVIEINDEYIPFLKENFFEMNNSELKYFLRAELTTGTIEMGYNCPNLEKYIVEHTSEELSTLINNSIQRDIKIKGCL